MARLPRVHLPGVPSHVIVRGNNRQAIFGGDGDRIHLHRILVEVSREEGLAVHAYVLMGNHVHLLATPGARGAIGRAIQRIGRQYVAHFNRVHGRSGTLWEGRYRSSLVESERYLMTCQRYIELNPVRAGIVAAPFEYPWSSFRSNAFGTPDDLVSPHAVFGGLACDDEGRRRAYLELFDVPLSSGDLANIRACANSGWALGSPGFRQRAQSAGGRRCAPLAPGRPRGAAECPEMGV